VPYVSVSCLFVFAPPDGTPPFMSNAIAAIEAFLYATKRNCRKRVQQIATLNAQNPLSSSTQIGNHNFSFYMQKGPTPQSTMLCAQSAKRTPQSTMLCAQSAKRTPQSTMLCAQSAKRTAQSARRKAQSKQRKAHSTKAQSAQHKSAKIAAQSTEDGKRGDGRLAHQKQGAHHLTCTIYIHGTIGSSHL